MAMHHRLSRLERTIKPSSDGLRSCRECRNGENTRTIFLMEGEPMYGGPREAICPACGRDCAYIINIVKAEPPPGWTPRPP